ncbi:sodium- and chloride-dependent glycine transporter 2-like isoform X2 [Tubulanus polymorphus]|uniref:sodium- and chloride-dependent glycine transporter 2-like isoform X2 n=1 Tax=Tubulanus polymorphus TaxID=672921 RepID=UPI003DA594FF
MSVIELQPTTNANHEEKIPIDGPSDTSSEDSENARGHWGKQLDFILSCVGYAVGLGNIWRFPYLCMRNGGGAFLIPYFTFMVLGGIPLFFMELSIGQFSSLGPLSVWKYCPLFRGIGWGMIIVSGIYTLDYNVIIAWILFYLGNSFSWELPWGSCKNDWNTPNCRERGSAASILVLCNSSISDCTENATYSITTPLNATANITTNITGRIMSPAEEFWQFKVLDMSDGIGTFGGLHWQLVLCHLASWTIVFFCLIRGVKSSGKVVYVTATVPYFFLFALLIRGATLPGSLNGVKYYISPDWSKLLSFKIWAEACMQIFFSLGPAWGGLITMASYNKFHHNCYRDAFIVPLVNCGTSFFAGFVVFSIIGYMAHEAKVPVEDAITSGPGLAFIAYPEALTKLPGSAIWAVCFFIMLLTIGLDSQFVTFETLTTGFVDQFPKQLRKRKLLFTFSLVILEVIVGLLTVCRAGIYWFQLIDWYSAAFSIMLFAIIECLVLSYIYGLNRLYDEIRMMIGYYPIFVWKICWCAITPLLLVVCLLYALIKQVAPYYGTYFYPPWAIVAGWTIASVSVVPIPIFMALELRNAKGTFWEKLKFCITPDPTWGPAERSIREEVNYGAPPPHEVNDASKIAMKDLPSEKTAFLHNSNIPSPAEV